MLLEWKLTLCRLGRLEARAFWLSAVADADVLLLPVDKARRFALAALGADGIGMEASFLPRDAIEDDDTNDDEEEGKDDDDAPRSTRDDDDDETAVLLRLDAAALAVAVGDVGHILLLPLLGDDCGCGGEALSISAIVVTSMLRVCVAY